MTRPSAASRFDVDHARLLVHVRPAEAGACSLLPDRCPDQISLELGKGTEDVENQPRCRWPAHRVDCREADDRFVPWTAGSRGGSFRRVASSTGSQADDLHALLLEVELPGVMQSMIQAVENRSATKPRCPASPPTKDRPTRMSSTDASSAARACDPAQSVRLVTSASLGSGEWRRGRYRRQRQRYWLATATRCLPRGMVRMGRRRSGRRHVRGGSAPAHGRAGAVHAGPLRSG